MIEPSAAQLRKRFNPVSGLKSSSAERRLMVAILNRAIEDLKLSHRHTVDHLITLHNGRSSPSLSPVSQLMCDESIEWIMSDSRSDLGFLHICDELDLDVKITRRKAVEIYRSNWRAEAERLKARRVIEFKLDRVRGVASL